MVACKEGEIQILRVNVTEGVKPMNRRNNILILFYTLSASLLFSSGMNAKQPLSASAQDLPSLDIPSVDIVKTAHLAGTYRGRARLPNADAYQPATLTLNEGLADTNFVLQVKGEPTIRGRIAGSLFKSTQKYASLKVFENPEMLGATKSSVLSLRLVKTDDGVTLKEEGTVLFEPCLPHPKCNDQSGCEPCEP